MRMEKLSNMMQKTEINSKHFCSVFKMMENLFNFYSDMATLSIPTVTDFNQPFNVNI